MTTEVFDTIVVGAGISGLTTARLLQQAGQHVLVLEARERIGGRVHSVRSTADASVIDQQVHGVAQRVTDYGASWIHGIEDGPVFELCEKFGLQMREFTVGSYQPHSRPTKYFAPDAAPLSAAAQEQHIADIALVDGVLTELITTIAVGTEISYQEVADTAIERCVSAGTLTAARGERVREFLQHRAEEQYGVQASQLDAHGLDDDQTNGDEMVFPNGYDELAAELARGLDIHCGYRVVEVDWSEPGAVKVIAETAHGAQVFTAPRAVVTVPVGILKSLDFQITPALPALHAQALAGMDMNAFEKIFLRFPEKFWDDHLYAFRRQGKAGKWWHSWYDLTVLHGEPTLLTFAAGDCAKQIINWSDNEIVAAVMTALREIYPGAPEPTAVDITRWQQDPFTRGSYAYMLPGNAPEMHDALATPIGHDGQQPTLFLAGEATWTDDPATVTAAVSSGHRAAEQILGCKIPVLSLAD